MNDIREADWKILRKLADVALERFCKRVLDEATPLVAGPETPSKSYHERFLELCRLIHRRNKELADTFDDLRRSMALIQLAHMRHHQLFTEEEFMQFSQETRDFVERALNF